MKYKIGEVSKIVGISADLIRYYEEKGIVTPEKDPNTGYRYYSVEDTNHLIDSLHFKNFGFTLDQSALLVHSSDAASLAEELQENEAVLQQELVRTRMLLAHSRGMRAILSDIAEGRYHDLFELGRRPALLYFAHRNGQAYLKSQDVEAATSEWLGYSPFAARTFCIPSKCSALPTRDMTYSWGFSLTSEDAQSLGASAHPPIRLVPEIPCAHVILRGRGDTFTPDILAPGLQWMSEQGLPVGGDIFGRLIVTTHEKRHGALPTNYYEVWFPMEKQENSLLTTDRM